MFVRFLEKYRAIFLMKLQGSFTKIQLWLLSLGMARPQVVCRKFGFHIPLLVANTFNEMPRMGW
jgi:hypothetical protein